MSLPTFYAQAPRILLRDPLAELLGAADGGQLEYSYADAVRLAGHSCPTVAGAYLMARAALSSLYPNDLPERGGMRVTMCAAETEGTTGVIAQVFTLLTGAAAGNGFHGIAGHYARQYLLHYGSGDSPWLAQVCRMDNGAMVRVGLDLSHVLPVPQMRLLMGQALAAEASPEVRLAFAQAWQDRVRRLLLEHADDPEVIRVWAFD